MESHRQKVLEIFRDLVGERAAQISVPISTAQHTIAQALEEEYPAKVARDIAFHLTDWDSDAAFIVAITLFPERFTPDEIRDAVGAFIVHAPNHTAAAAKLGGFPVADIFKIGAVGGGNDL